MHFGCGRYSPVAGHLCSVCYDDDDEQGVELADPEVEWQNHPERAPDWYYPTSEPVSGSANDQEKQSEDQKGET
jgi:hypothetical protein